MWKRSAFAEDKDVGRTNIAQVLLPAYLGQVEELGDYLDEQELKDLDNLMKDRTNLGLGCYQHSKSGKIVYLDTYLFRSHAKPTVATFWNAIFQTDLFAPLDFGKGTIGYESVKKLHEKVFFHFFTQETVGLHLYNETQHGTFLREVFKCFEFFPKIFMLGEPSVLETMYRSKRLKEWLLARKSSHFLGQQSEELLQQIYAEKSFEQLLPFLFVGIKGSTTEVIGDYVLSYKNSELVVERITTNAVSAVNGQPAILKDRIKRELVRPFGLSNIVVQYGDLLQLSSYKKKQSNYAQPYGYRASDFVDSAIKFSNFTDLNDLPKPTLKPLNIIVPNDILQRTKLVETEIKDVKIFVLYYTTMKGKTYYKTVPKYPFSLLNIEQLVYEELFKYLLDYEDNVFKKKAFLKQWRLLE